MRPGPRRSTRSSGRRRAGRRVDPAEPFGAGPDEPARTRPAARRPRPSGAASSTPVRSVAASAAASQRSAGLDEADLERARAIPEDYAAVRARLRDRFPVVEGGAGLVDGLLDLHTPRQLVGLEAILDRIEGDLRAAPVEAALRLAFLHALLPASRLNGYPGPDRVAPDPGRPGPAAGRRSWRERNPWLAFEDGIRTVRGFIQRLESGPGGAVQARLGNDLRSARRRQRDGGRRDQRAIDDAGDRRGGVARPRLGRRVRRPGLAAGSGSSSASRRSGRTRSGCR